MNIEDIKVGEMLNIKLLCTCKEKRAVIFETPTGGKIQLGYRDFEALSPITPYTPLNLPTMTKIPETYPKYDPNREFKKGDKVRLVTRFGRQPFCHRMKEWIVPSDTILTVICDEVSGHVKIQYEEGFVSPMIVSAHFLELVTPVEELEPYSVHETDYLYRVMQSVDGGEQVVCEYRKSYHPHAKEADEAERDRLNAEYRKEQS